MNDFYRLIKKYSLDTQIFSVCPIDHKKKCELELTPYCKSEFDVRSSINNDFGGNERKMVSIFNDHCSDHLPHWKEEIGKGYHSQIEDQRLASERNQRRFNKPN
jgi:hypothetical protein